MTDTKLEKKISTQRMMALRDAREQYNLGVAYCSGKEVPQDYQEAVKWFRLAAEQGLNQAQLALGVCYETGEGVNKDYKEAARLYTLAAKQGNVSAQIKLGCCYETGAGVNKDHKEAARLYTLAAKQGNVSAQIKLGCCYETGAGVNKDHKEAARLYTLAAKQGNVSAQIKLGCCYETGAGVNKDHKEAARLYKLAAEQGQAFAQYKLGTWYQIGQGVDTDYKEAARLYKLAAEQGQASAQYNLSQCYENGEGVEKDSKEVFKWSKRSADQGVAEAQYQLGMCYGNGEGISQDYNEAFTWYQRSAEQGFAAAKTQLGTCYKYGWGIPKDYKEAIKWYSQAAEQGSLAAQYNLGIFYEQAEGVQRDYHKAFKWYVKAAGQGHLEAHRALGMCYEKGWGVAQDYKEAANWYKLAAAKGDNKAQSDLSALSEKLEKAKDAKEKRSLPVQGRINTPSSIESKQEFKQQILPDPLELTDAETQYKLGEGQEVIQDYKEAAKWYQLAAAQGNEKAKSALSLLPEKICASSGDVAAQFELARRYANGDGVDKNLDIAAHWYSESVKNGGLGEISLRELAVEKANKTAEGFCGDLKNKPKRDLLAPFNLEASQAQVIAIQNNDPEIKTYDQLEDSKEDKQNILSKEEERLNFQVSYNLQPNNLQSNNNQQEFIAPESPRNLSSTGNGASIAATENLSDVSSEKLLADRKRKSVQDSDSFESFIERPRLTFFAGLTQESRITSEALKSPDEKKSKNIAEAVSTYPAHDSLIEFKSTAADDFKSAEPPGKAAALPSEPAQDLRCELKSSDLQLNAWQRRGLNKLAELQESLNDPEIELTLRSSFILELAAYAVLGEKCFIADDMDVTIDLRECPEKLGNVQAALKKIGFTCSNPGTLDQGYLNFTDETTKVEISIKLPGYSQNFNPFLLTSVSMGFKKSGEDAFDFTLNKEDAALLDFWLKLGAFPVQLPDSYKDVSHFLKRLLKYSLVEKNSLIPYYIGEKNEPYDDDDLDDYLESYFDELFKTGTHLDLCHHYKTMEQSIEYKAHKSKLFSNPAAESIIYHFCLAHLNARFGAYYNQEAAQNMTKFLQNYFLEIPSEGNKFSDYLKELIQLGPYKLKNPLHITSIMLKHMIDNDSFSKSPKYIAFCCRCSLAKQYPEATPQDLQRASANMAIVLINCRNSFDRRGLFRSMESLVKNEVSFLADTNNINILTEKISSDLFVDPRLSPFDLKNQYNYSPAFNYSPRQPRNQETDNSPRVGLIQDSVATLDQGHS